MNQKTIIKEISCSGTGLHTGLKVSLKMIPAKIDHGIVFKRIDIKKKKNLIKANLTNVSSTKRCTEISENNINVITIEHFLAALYYFGVTNLLIEIDQKELPIFDGSSYEYCKIIKKAGVLTQRIQRKKLKLSKQIIINSKKTPTNYILSPSNKLAVSVKLNYDKEIIGENFAKLNDINKFEDEISKCRTFCLLSEIEFFMDNKLILGGNLDNCIIYKDKVLDKEKLLFMMKKFKVKKLNSSNKKIVDNRKLRFKNESARHKILDLIGDLSLTQMDLEFDIKAYMPSHKENILLAKKIIDLNKKNLL